MRRSPCFRFDGFHVRARVVGYGRRWWRWRGSVRHVVGHFFVPGCFLAFLANSDFGTETSRRVNSFMRSNAEGSLGGDGFVFSSFMPLTLLVEGQP